MNPDNNLMKRVQILTGLSDYPSSSPFHPDHVYPEFAESTLGSIGGTANLVYQGVRALLAGLGLDASRYGTKEWNPLREQVDKGGRVMIKPNMVRHWNANVKGTWQSVVTHWSVVRPLIDYALLAVGPSGRVIVGDAPHWDCDMTRLQELLGVKAFISHYDHVAPGQVHFVDFRPEWFDAAGPVKGEPRSLAGDKNGYILVDLGPLSMFNDSALNPILFYGSGYDQKVTIAAHTGGHKYLIAGSALKNDLFISVPKLKTHHLLGITVAMKNLVGINGDKNYLPHFRLGFPDMGGDQYPVRTIGLRCRHAILKRAMPFLASRPKLRRVWGHALAMFHSAGGQNPFAGGAWIGNDTVWRMVLDLNRILFYCSEDGRISPGIPARNYLTIVDGIIAGEGEGPMAPLDRRAGVLLAAGHPLTCDVVAAKLMGFNPQHLRLCVEGLRDHPLPSSPVSSWEEIQVSTMSGSNVLPWRGLMRAGIPNLKFVPPRGWSDLAR